MDEGGRDGCMLRHWKVEYYLYLWSKLAYRQKLVWRKRVTEMDNVVVVIIIIVYTGIRMKVMQGLDRWWEMRMSRSVI